MPQAPEPSLTGTTIQAARVTVERVAGSSAFAQGLATLPAADRELYLGATTVSWVPVRIVDALVVAVASAANMDPVKLNAAASRLSVDQTLRTVWRALLRFTSDEALVARTPVFYSKTFSHGRLASHVHDKASTITLTDWPTVSEIQIAGLAAGIEAVLVAAGRKDVKMTWTKTPTGARCQATWR